MATYTIDTNAGPIVSVDRRTPAEVRRYMEARIPLLDKRGYSWSWRRRGEWHVIDVFNSKQRLVHSAAFQERSAPMSDPTDAAAALPEIGQRIRHKHGGAEGHLVYEGLVTEIRTDPSEKPIVAETDEGVRFYAHADQWEPWISRQERLAAQIFMEPMAQLEELSVESGEFLEDAADEKLAEDLRGSLMAALEQRYADWLADNGLGQP